ncbi:MAG TPA: DUF5103 domain-containing protein, partial [Prevotella sp.]
MLFRRLTFPILLAFSLLFPHASHSQNNAILHPRIASLQVTAAQNWLVHPVAGLYDLNQNPIVVSFDDLTHEYHRYT